MDVSCYFVHFYIYVRLIDEHVSLWCCVWYDVMHKHLLLYVYGNFGFTSVLVLVSQFETTNQTEY